MKQFSIKNFLYPAVIAGTIVIAFIVWKEETMKDFYQLPQPMAPLKPHEYEVHGAKESDPYAWLRDPQWKTPADGVKDPEILAYIESENQYSHAFFKPLASEIKEIFEERRGFLQKIDESVPIKRDNYLYYSRQSLDQNYPIYLRKKNNLEAAEEIIMDVNVEAKKHSYFNLNGFSISPSHNLLAFTSDTSGNEFFELKVRDLTTKNDLKDTIPNVAGGVVWNVDNSGFYYVQLSPEWRPKKLFQHKLGTPYQEDSLIYEEKDDHATIGIGRTSDRHFLVLESGIKDENAVFILDLLAEKPSLIQLMAREKNRLVNATEHYQGKFYHLINDSGPNFRLVSRTGDSENLEELLAHNPAIYLTNISVYEKGMVLSLTENGLGKIGYFDLDKNQYINISLPGQSYALHLMATPYESNEVRFSYSALNKPPTVYGCMVGSTDLKALKVQEIPSGFDESLYECERLWVEARDGVRVPVTVAYRKDLVKLGQANPVLLYGYGSYGYGIEPGFRHSALSMMNRGLVYAIAHIRGGDDLGYQWYLDGKMLNKKNTFNDFIDCAEHLVKAGYTHSGFISAMGGSAGGMLMGAVVNDRPELFKAIVAQVPFVDVVNTMLDDTLPLTPGEYAEWGNPQEKQYLDYIKSYSPYDNVKQQSYPAMYVTGGLTDPRVTYWEPTKWVAKLRHYNTGNQPILLKMLMGAGHAGASKRDEQLWEDAEDLAFLLQIYGK